MHRVEVALGERSYPVLVGPGILDATSNWAPFTGQGHLLVVSNDRVAPLYLDRVMNCLPAGRTSCLVLPDGEVHKTVETWSRVLDELVRLRAGRDACLVALGGGVIGDLCGFAAASWMRGVSFVQAPTTLLAQVDASVGGKTGVNHPRGKNLIGAFHQPRAVLADTSTLLTLPDREYAAGLAEVVKYGMIRDAAFFEWLETHADAVAARQAAAVEFMVERSIRNKAQVVAGDELEAGARALLNFGHSFGHALETLTGYSEYLHGEAVAIGMVIAARLSELRRLAADGVTQRLSGLLQRFDLPVTLPSHVSGRDILDSLLLDKKTLSGTPRLILVEAIGSARVDADSQPDETLAAIEECRV